MKSRRLQLALAALAGLGAVAVAAIMGWPGAAVATPGSQFNSEILVRSFFERIAVGTERPRHHHHHHRRGDDDADDFNVKIKARDPSDVYVVRNRVPPGGHSGWHTHPGPSIVSVKSGTATVYDGDDPSCAGVTYPAGTGFIDEGGDHVHMVRNEGAVELEVIAFQIVPAGSERRVDAPDPGFCPF